MTDKKNLQVTYGIHAVAALIGRRLGDVVELKILEGNRAAGVISLEQNAQQGGVKISRVSAAELRRVSGDGVHQGVVALAQPRPEFDENSLERMLAQGAGFFLILDSIDDPRNLGACLRAADGAGVDGVILGRNRGARITSLVAKVASGAAETVPCIRVANLARTLRFLRAAGVYVLGAEGDAVTTMYESTVGRSLALVVGSEGKGLRRLTREQCDQLVSIPMRGAVTSLNVSVAAAVMLYELQRRRSQFSEQSP